jgi:putative ABC transport system permease protein
MIKTRGRKILRDLWSRKARTLLASLSIFVGVLGVVILVTMGDLLIRQLNEDLKPQELAMQQLSITVASGTEVDNAAYLDGLEELPGVARVEGRAVYPVFWKHPGEADFTEGSLRAYWEPFGEIQIQPPRLTGVGRWPVAGQNEMAIEKRMADEQGLSVGDQLTLRVLGAGQAGEVPEETYTVVGIVFQPYTYFGEQGFLPNETSVFAAYDDAKEIAGFTGLTRFYVRYTDFPTAEEQADVFQTAVIETTPYIPVFGFVDDPENNIFLEITEQISAILIILAAVALIVSGFLVVNIVNSIVVEQKRQIGVMKSLGATRSDNVLMYTGAALAYGILGTIPGVILGVVLGYQMAAGIAPQANSLIESFRVSTVGVIVGVVMGLAVPLISALIPVVLGTRVTILEAMTDLGISADYGRGIVARIIGAVPMTITLRQALTNLNRKKGRLLLTGITLTLAVAAFMAVFGIFFSLGEIISSFFETTNFEISVTPSESQDFLTTQALILDQVDAVEQVFPGVDLTVDMEGYVDAQFGGSTVFVSGFDPATDAIDLRLEAGTAWQGDAQREGIVLTSSLAKVIEKELGDAVVIQVGGQTEELEIIGLSSFPVDQAFMEWRQLSRLAGLTLGAPTPNEYAVPVHVEGFNGSLPEGQALALGFDEMAGGFLQFDEGAFVTPGRPGAVVSAQMAAAGNWQVGDEVTLSVAGNEATVPILGVFVLPPQMGEGIPPDVVGMYWQDLAALEGRDLSGEPTPNAFLVRINRADPTAEEVDEVIKQISDTLVDAGITATFGNQVASAEESAAQIQSIGAIFTVTALVMAAVGAIGLLATLSMAVFERQKEIGVMRSIGAGSVAVAGQFLVEGILVGVIAWVIGVPLSILLAQGLAAALPFGVTDIDYPPISLLIGLAGMIIVATISSLWPSISAARKTVSEILRYQ